MFLRPAPKVVKHCPEGHEIPKEAAGCPRCGWARASGQAVSARSMTEMTVVLGAPPVIEPPAPAEPEGNWVLRLEATSGPLLQQRFDVEPGRWKVGRQPKPEAGFSLLTIPDPGLSREHFRLEVGIAAAILVDLGSTNGTFIGSRRVERHILADGETLLAGASGFRIHLRLQAPA